MGSEARWGRRGRSKSASPDSHRRGRKHGCAVGTPFPFLFLPHLATPVRLRKGLIQWIPQGRGVSSWTCSARDLNFFAPASRREQPPFGAGPARPLAFLGTSRTKNSKTKTIGPCSSRRRKHRSLR